MEQKADARAENAELKKQLSALGTEVSDLNRKIESKATSSPSKKTKIPELSEAVKALLDNCSESEKFEGSERCCPPLL
jgi:peptidoglycan hydrolase CwlO-like protein